ncbi:MAG: peptide-methionine (S)-S-oxide reductase MsrA [Rhodospirillaceae bacterium]|nr:peptide-methionine (S)-S-oxide reductase MsrA [Rhodospirillaceae bacterium]
MNLRSLWNGLFTGILLSGAVVATHPAAAKGEAIATFAGGCFWCVESDFDTVKGVKKPISGYTGGLLRNPTYKQVVAGGTGHLEAVQIHYDPQVTSYEKLLDVFWHSVDPTDAGGQFCDRGASYATAIFANSPEQKKIAEKSKAALVKSGALKKPIVTPVVAASTFTPAEGYHQDYYTKNPLRYRFYRTSCGRDRRIKALWGEDAHRGIEKH